MYSFLPNMCLPVDIRAFLYGLWFTTLGLYIYFSYKSQQRLQKNYDAYVNALFRLDHKPSDDNV